MVRSFADEKLDMKFQLHHMTKYFLSYVSRALRKTRPMRFIDENALAVFESLRMSKCSVALCKD